MNFPIFGKKNDNPAGFNPPSMTQIMAWVGKYLPMFAGAKDDKGKMKEAVGSLVADFATDKNIAMVATGITEAIVTLQQKNNTRYVVHIEAASDDKDLCINIMSRLPDGSLVMVYSRYLNQLTQQEIIHLVNLVFKNGE